MKIAIWGVSLAGALVLSACNVTMPYAPPQQNPHMHTHIERHHEQSRDAGNKPMVERRFQCQNGLYVNIRALRGDRIELRLDDKRAVLTQAVSGSGERYVGKQGLFGTGAEWHQKGDDAIFNFKDPYGNAVETSCRAM